MTKFGTPVAVDGPGSASTKPGFDEVGRAVGVAKLVRLSGRVAIALRARTLIPAFRVAAVILRTLLARLADALVAPV